MTAGTIVALCTSARQGTVKQSVPASVLRAGHGVVGDAHAGTWHRQVSVLADESIARLRGRLPDIAPGAFGENVVTVGVDLTRLAIGDRLLLGSAVVLEVTQIGKECHDGCAIRQQVGDCVMPREGIFCRVVAGGELRTGDPVRLQGGRRVLVGGED